MKTRVRAEEYKKYKSSRKQNGGNEEPTTKEEKRQKTLDRMSMKNNNDPCAFAEEILYKLDLKKLEHLDEEQKTAQKIQMTLCFWSTV